MLTRTGILLCGLSLITLVACQEEPPPAGQNEQGTGSLATGETRNKEQGVVAFVDGDAIRLAMVEREALQVTGRPLDELDRDTVDKLIEAVVTRRAIASKAEKSMDEEALRRLDTEVRACRETLMVKQYLADHVEVQPVTEEMVREYYERNKARYASSRDREYQILTVKETGNDSGAVLDALQTAKTQTDWTRARDRIRRLGGTATLGDGPVKRELLKPTLARLLDSLAKEGETRLTDIQGDLYLVRLTRVGNITHKPLEEVGTSIRRALSAEQVKQAVESLGDRVLQGADIERIGMDTGQSGSD